MVSVTSASRYIMSVPCYHPCYQSRPSIYIRGLIPWIFAEMAEAVPFAFDVGARADVNAAKLWLFLTFTADVLLFLFHLNH